jgi:hypothetical protein
MRYYIRCKLNPGAKSRLADSIKSGSLAHSNVFYEGMQTALRDGTIDENNYILLKHAIAERVDYILWLWRFQY